MLLQRALACVFGNSPPVPSTEYGIRSWTGPAEDVPLMSPFVAVYEGHDDVRSLLDFLGEELGLLPALAPFFDGKAEVAEACVSEGALVAAQLLTTDDELAFALFLVWSAPDALLVLGQPQALDTETGNFHPDQADCLARWRPLVGDAFDGALTWRERSLTVGSG